MNGKEEKTDRGGENISSNKRKNKIKERESRGEQIRRKETEKV